MGIHRTSDKSNKSCWFHANPLRCCLDWSNTQQEPDRPEVMVCTPDPVGAISAFRWSILAQDVVTCSKGRWKAWAAVEAEPNWWFGSQLLRFWVGGKENHILNAMGNLVFGIWVGKCLAFSIHRELGAPSGKELEELKSMTFCPF